MAAVLGKAGVPRVEQACPRHCDAPVFRGERPSGAGLTQPFPLKVKVGWGGDAKASFRRSRPHCPAFVYIPLS